MGFITDIFGGGSETVTQQANLTPEQRELINRQVELADFQLAELRRQQRFQRTAFEGAEEQAGIVESEAARQTARSRELEPVQDELLGLQLERIRAGGQATPEEVDLINQAVEQALAAGETDIERFRSQGLESLREELAPQLGLRPGDTPILDRGGRIVAESQLQQGQLVRGLRGQQAQSLLNFPLQRASVLGGLTGGQQELTENIQRFQSQLQQSAFTNRLQLAGARSTAGLGLAGVSAPNIGPAFSNVGTTETSSGGAGFGEIAGGIGAVLLGIGAI